MTVIYAKYSETHGESTEQGVALYLLTILDTLPGCCVEMSLEWGSRRRKGNNQGPSSGCGGAVRLDPGSIAGGDSLDLNVGFLERDRVDVVSLTVPGNGGPGESLRGCRGRGGTAMPLQGWWRVPMRTLRRRSAAQWAP